MVWIADYEDAGGRRHRPQFATREEAEEFLREALENKSEGPAIHNEDPKVTLAEYRQRWERRAAQEVAPSTLRCYAYYLDQHVEPALGHLPVRRITRGAIRDLLSRMRERGYAKNTVRLARASLSVVLSAAVDDTIIRANPALGLRRRSRADRQSNTERIDRLRPLSVDEMQHFLAASETAETRYAALFWTLGYAGLRPGEVLALEEADLDFDARKITVRRAFSIGRIESTKTGETRQVDMARALERRLRSHLRARREEALRRGWGEMPSLLFVSSSGTALDYANVARAFRRCLRAAKIEAQHSPYDLRHSFATNLLAQGAPITYVAAQLGHSKPTTTLRWYAHWLPSNKQRFVDLLGDPWQHARHQKITMLSSRDVRQSQVPDFVERARGESNTRPTDSKIDRVKPTVIRQHSTRAKPGISDPRSFPWIRVGRGGLVAAW